MFSGILCRRAISRNLPNQRFARVCFRVALAVVLCVFFADGVKGQFRFDNWTTDDGLPQNTVRRIVQTSDGYIWFTTLDGLVRFNGVRFTVFNKFNSQELPSNRFVNLLAEPDDTLWISTEEHGAIRFRGGVFTSFTTADGLPSNRVFEVLRDLDGNLTVLTSDGLAKFDGVGFTKVASEPDSISVRHYAARSGAIWQLNRETLIASRDGQKKTFDLPETLKSMLRTERNVYWASRVFEDPKGDIWITANQADNSYSVGRLWKFSGGRFEEIVAKNFPRNLVSGMETDRNGDLWLTIVHAGACRLKNDRFECFSSENGLPTNDIRSILRDREGSLWLATENKGICHISEQYITSVSTAQGLQGKNAYVIYKDSLSAIWLGTLGTLERYRDGAIKKPDFAGTFRYVDVQSILEDRNGRIWIGTLGGIYYFEDGQWENPIGHISLPYPDLTIYDIHQDRQGTMWFASNFGLFRSDGKSFELLTTANGLPGNNVRIILENDDGSFWLGTLAGISLYKDGTFTNFDDHVGLAGNHVRSLYKDGRGTLWIGTYDSGLSRFKDGKFTNYTIENGLSSNGAFQIFEDSGKNFWISSNQGIYRVSRIQLDEFAEGRRSLVSSTRFGKTDGMLNTEANGGAQPAGLQFDDGKLWFPTQDGVAIVDTARVRTNELAPPVVIEEARVNNQRVSRLTGEIKLSPNEENLEIDYTGLSFIKPEQVRFLYKLDGLDENWNEANNRRTAFYPHLAPGEYVFRVIAANSDNVWNERGASIKVIVLPPFYRTWWFVTLSVIAIAAFIFWFNQRRVDAIRRKHLAQEEFSRRLIAAHESERRRVAAELHDSLGQTLAMIKNRAVFARQNSGDLDKAMAEFELITDQSVEAINEVREISYNLRPYLLERLGLTKALKSLFNKTAENSQLKVKAELENIDKIFTSEEEMNLYRIIQESLNNILKHADAENVEIEIRRTERELIVKIADDGRGFVVSTDPSEPKKGGFGLLGMSERIKILGGTQRLESAIGKGTTISLWIDLSERIKSRTNG